MEDMGFEEQVLHANVQGSMFFDIEKVLKSKIIECSRQQK